MTLSFARPGILLFGFLILLLVMFWRRKEQQTQSLLSGLGWLIQAQQGNGRSRRFGLWLTALSLALIALAGPRWGEQTQVVNVEGLQLLILLDLSQSMLADDVPGGRLAQAQQIISTATTTLTEHDEVGLAVFAGETRLILPLTPVYSGMDSLVSQLHPTLLSEQGTVLESALKMTGRFFPTPHAGQPLVLIISDGEDHGSGVLRAAQTAVRNDIILLTVGVGTEKGATVPILDEAGQVIGVKQDMNNQPVISRLEAKVLQDMSKIGNGRYLSGDMALTQLPDVLAEIRAAHTGQRVVVQPIERFQLFLLIAILLLGASNFPSIPASLVEKLRWLEVPVGLLILCIWLAGCRPRTPADWIRQGNHAFAAAEYQQALTDYETAVALNPDTAVAPYNLANTHYRLQQYQQAAQIFQQTLDKITEELIVDLFFNQGNAFFQMEDYEQAIAAYQAALRRQPDNLDAKHNLELALQQLEERPSLSTIEDDSRLEATVEQSDAQSTVITEPEPGSNLPSEMVQDLLVTATEGAKSFPISSDIPAANGRNHTFIKDW